MNDTMNDKEIVRLPEQCNRSGRVLHQPESSSSPRRAFERAVPCNDRQDLGIGPGKRLLSGPPGWRHWGVAAPGARQIAPVSERSHWKANVNVEDRFQKL
jgi:hypothetical protein